MHNIVLSVSQVLKIYLFTVDFLAQVGFVPGENGSEPDRALSDATDTAEWQQISADYPIGFAVYSQVVLDDYSGSLAQLSGSNGSLNIDIGSSGLLRILTVTLPGDNPLIAAIPGAWEPGVLQAIGVSVQSKLLSVIVDCHVITSVWLANMPDSLDFTSAEVLNPPTTVSVR